MIEFSNWTKILPSVSFLMNPRLSRTNNSLFLYAEIAWFTILTVSSSLMLYFAELFKCCKSKSMESLSDTLCKSRYNIPSLYNYLSAMWLVTFLNKLDFPRPGKENTYTDYILSLCRSRSISNMSRLRNIKGSTREGTLKILGHTPKYSTDPFSICVIWKLQLVQFSGIILNFLASAGLI